MAQIRFETIAQQLSLPGCIRTARTARKSAEIERKEHGVRSGQSGCAIAINEDVNELVDDDKDASASATFRLQP